MLSLRLGGCVLALGVLAAGCADRTAPLRADPLEAAALPGGARLQCAVDVSASQFTCASPGAVDGDDASGSRLVLGGQGTYVRIVGTNVSYSSGTQTFSADVTVQNLTGQLLGTSDGSTVTGIKVFLNAGPTTTAGTGAVTVQNADGSGTFTASNQPFFEYNEILGQHGAISASKQWKFTVPTTVTTFTFSVLVSASVPDESGALRWMIERSFGNIARSVLGIDSRTVFGSGANLVRFDGERWAPVSGGPPRASGLQLWASSSTNVWQVGALGQIERYDGRTMESFASGTTVQLNAVWGSSPSDIWAGSISTGGMFHFDGSSWSTHAGVGGSSVVWKIRGLSSTDIWAVGRSVGAQGQVYHWDGSAWSIVGGVPVVSGTFRDVWPVSTSEVWVVGQAGTILKFDGSTWTQVPSGTSQVLWSIWRASASHMLAVGDSGAIVKFDGSTWSALTPEGHSAGLHFKNMWGSAENDVWMTAGPSTGLANERPIHFDGTKLRDYGPSAGFRNLNRLWASSATDVYAVGLGGSILRNTGGGWAQEVSGTARNLNGVWGTSASDIWAVGDTGTALHRTGSSWNAISTGITTRLTSVWASASSDVWAVGDNGTIIRFDGSTWSPSASGTAEGLRGVAGTSSSSVFAVGSTGTIIRFNGAIWESMTSGVTSPLNGVWAAATNDVWAVGNTGVLLHFDGSTWSTVSLGTTVDLVVVWGSSASDVWVGGGSGALYHWNGSTWRAINSGVTNTVVAVWALSPTNVYLLAGTAIVRGTR